jgi:ketosteroid isomerase-like protein
MKGERTMKGYRKQVIVITFALALAAAGCKPTDLAGIVRQDAEAINKGNIASIMSHYTEDAVLISRPFCPPEVPCNGKFAIEQAYRNMISGGTSATVVSQEVSGNTVKSRMEARGGAAKAAGVERFVYYNTMTFAGDKIAKKVSEYDMSDSQTATFLKWVQAQSQ